MKGVAARLANVRALAGNLPRPRPTVRLRLTLLYGGLFLASGIGLLLLTNVLVHQATGNLVLFAGPGQESDPGAGVTFQLGEFTGQFIDPSVTQLLDAQAEEFRDSVAEQRAEDRRQLMIQSGVALGVMTVVALGLGWIVAGRVLRPLRTITATAREISANNLHQRLALGGPDDELKELGDTFDELLRRLERTFEAQRQFVANASHELRTPLARQRTLVEVALSDPDATVESLRDTYERVLVSEEQQERLIESLLTLARSERGLDHRTPLDLTAVIDDVLVTAQPELDRHGISVQSTFSDARTFGDPALVERLVTNLIDNAVRHNLPRGSIDIMTGTRDGYCLLSVSNTGSSIPPEDVERLFQPFRRLGQDRIRQTDGHGIGLSIVQAIASAHGATLHAAARPEGGLDVEVRFPVCKLARHSAG